MTFILAGRIEMEDAAARQALRAAGQDVDELTRKVRAEAGAAEAGAGANRRLAGGVDAAARSADQMAASTTRATAAARANAQVGAGMQRQMQLAGGSIANLGYQFNDLAIMMAAGQNPLQMAMQQGAQITQVIGPLGAAGAVRALGTAFMSLLNPVSLVTIGTIAAGGFLVKWLTSGREGAVSLEEALDNLNKRVDAYVEASQLARRSTAEWRAEEGRFATDARSAAERAAEDQRRQILEGTRAALNSGPDEMRAGLDFAAGSGAQSREDYRRLNFDLSQSLHQLRIASHGSAEQMYAALQSMIPLYRQAALFSGEISQSEQDRIDLYEQQAAALREFINEQERSAAIKPTDFGQLVDLGANQERLEAQRLMMEAEAGRSGAQMGPRDFGQDVDLGANQERLAILRQMNASDREGVQLTADRQRLFADILVQAQSEARMARLAAQYGADSVQVAQARAAAIAAAVEQEWRAKGATEAQVQELVRAKLEAAGLASIDMASPIAAAANVASQLAQQLGISLGLAQALAGTGAGSTGPVVFDPRDPHFDPEAARLARLTQSMQSLHDNAGTVSPFDPSRLPSISTLGGGGGGGGGGAGASTEIEGQQDAIADLVARLSGEKAILLELNPVQQEMLRYRQELTGATAAQRAEIEALIAGNQRLEAQRETWDFMREGLSEVLHDLRPQQGENFLDALTRSAGRLVETLADAVWQAAFLNEGPMAGLFTSSSGGGWAGDLLSWLMPGAAGVQENAGGGMIYGQGGPRDDRVPAYVSAGEYIVNAAATQRNLPLLEAINSGTVPQFAAGGLARPAPAPASADATSPAAASAPSEAREQLHVFNINVSGSGDEQIFRGVRTALEVSFEHFTKHVLPGQVRTIVADPWSAD